MRHAAEEQGWAPGWHCSKGRGQKMLAQAKERGLSGNGLKAVPPIPCAGTETYWVTSGTRSSCVCVPVIAQPCVSATKLHKRVALRS